MRIHRQNKREACIQAGKHLGAVLAKYRKDPVLLLLSGGSAFEMLSHTVVPDDCRFLTVSVLDERFSPLLEENNFLQLRLLPFYELAKERGANFIDTIPKGDESLDQFAERFNGTLTYWRQRHAIGKILVTLGMGQDGHTAGIMPYANDERSFEDLFENERRWVVGYDAENKNSIPLRMTTTLPFIRRIDHGIAYITGESKRAAFEKMLAKETDFFELPARIFHSIKDLEIFTDIV